MLKRLPSVRKRMKMLSGRSSFASRSMKLKTIETNAGARTQPSLTPFEMGEAARERPIVLHLNLLTFKELAEDGERFWGTAKARQDFPHSITADSIKDLG